MNSPLSRPTAPFSLERFLASPWPLLRLTLAALAVWSLVACGGDAATESADPAQAAPAVSGQAPGEQATSDQASAESASDVGTGVPECDEYIEKYTACLEDHVPDSVRDSMRVSLEQSKKAWAEAGTTKEARDAMASACTTAMDAAKAAMSSYGCNWD